MFLRISPAAARYFGYFSDLTQTAPDHDPGIGVSCPICYRQLRMDDVRTISVMWCSGTELSCFYRVHKSCHEALSLPERDAIEQRLMALLPILGSA